MPTSASASPSPSTSTSFGAGADHRLTTVLATLGVVGLLLIAGIIIMTARFRVREPIYERPLKGSWSRKSAMPSARITPFGSPLSETPRHVFTHKPGENMRIAKRRSDGAWEFSSQRTPFSPAGVSELDVDLLPPIPSAPSSPSSSSFSVPQTPMPRASLKKSPLAYSKESEVMLSWQGAHSPTSPTAYSEYTEDIPPPAYVCDSHELVRGGAADWATPRRS